MYNGLLMVVAGLFGFNMAENIFKKAPIVTAPVDTPDGDIKPKDDPNPDAGIVVDNPDA